MSIKEKMADKWMEGMDPEEKEKMMNSMMDKFFAGMSADEKTKMMEHMMKKFVSGPGSEETARMMGGAPFMMKMMKMMGGGRHMKGMMSGSKDCCGGEEEGAGESEDAGPMDMCRRMMTTIGRTSDLAVYATPEVRGLFEEWAAQIEDEILQFIKESSVADADQIAARFKLSKDSAKYFLGRLSQKGKVTLKAEGSKGA